MPLAHQHHTIFVHVPKTGGTSMEKALGIRTHHNIAEEHPLRLFGRQLQHRTARELQETFINEEVFSRYFKFAFVRNPWARLASEYYYLLERKVINFPFEHFASDAFLRRTDLPGFIFDHLRPQVDFIFDANKQSLLDFVGRFEQIESDWNHVCERIKLNQPLPHHNQKKTTTPSYRELYNHSTRESVERFYIQDIETFNYSF